ncbi:MAG: ABC transporter permease [Clostridiaceae bacterium]
MWFKNFRHKKLQTFMIFVIIMLCSALLSASISILISLDKPYQQLAKECNSATASFTPYSQKDEVVRSIGEQFEGLPSVKRVEYERVHYINEELTFNNNKIESFSKLVEYNEAIYGKVRYVEGDRIVSEKLKENECIIPACVSNKYKISIGDNIKLHLNDKEIIFTVRGIYAETYNMSTAFDSAILVKKLPEGITEGLNIKIYGEDGIRGNDIKEAFIEKYDGQMNGIMNYLEGIISNNLLPNNILGGIFLAIGIIMLFVSCIIINFMIRNAMIMDAKTIAIYKTIGYNSNDVLRIYLNFYFLVVSLGCILGISGSVYLSNSILSSTFKNMGQVVVNSVFIPGILCYIVIVSFVLVVIYSIISKTKKVKPVYALNGMTNSSTKKKKNYKGNSKIQFSSIGIALRTLARNKKGAIGIVITSIFTIFSINFAVISLDVANTQKDNNDYWLGIEKCDVMISTTDSKSYDKVKDVIKEDSRVSYYLNSNIGTRVTMKWQKGMDTNFMNAFVFDDYSRTKLPIVKGRNPEAGNEIAIASKVADELNKSVGDYIEVYLGGEKRVNLLITGVFQTYFQMGYACRLTTDVYVENNYEIDYNNLSIYLKNQKEIETFVEELQDKVGGSGKVFERTEAFSTIMDMIVTPQKTAIPPVVILELLVGAINIFCIVLLKNANSAKTNGIYKCLGYSTRHLVLSNLYYVGIVATASMAVSIPMIIAVYPTIMKLCLSKFGLLEYPVTYNYWHIILTNIVVLIVFIISTLISSRSLKKVNVRDLVQE